MYSEWRNTTLEDIAEINMGQSPKSEFYNYEAKGIPFLQGNKEFGLFHPKIEKYTTYYKKKAEVGDILMSVRAPVGELNISTCEVAIGRGLCAIKAKKGNSTKYIYYLLKDNIKKLQNRSNGTVFQSINGKELKTLPIKIPEYVEQEKISNILYSLDNKIELNNKINTVLEELAQTLFKRWFLDFEFLNEEGKPYKSSGGKMEKSEIGEVPEGWDVIEINEIVDVVDNRGKTPPQVFDSKLHPIIDVKVLAGNGRLCDYANAMKYVSTETYNNWFRSGHPQYGDVLISTVGSLAEMKIYDEDNGCIAQNVVALRMKNGSFLYLYEYMNHIKNKLKSYDIGTVQPSIKVTQFLKEKIVLPPQDYLDKHEKLCKEVFDEMVIIKGLNDKLSNIRDVLLPKLMNGYFDINDGGLYDSE